MAVIKRTLTPLVREHNTRKILAVYGPHFCGKSSLVNEILQERGASVSLDGGDPSDALYLRSVSEDNAAEFLQDKNSLLIKNAHKVPGISKILFALARANKASEHHKLIVITSAIDLRLNRSDDDLFSFNIERLVNIDEESLLFTEVYLWPFTLNEIVASDDPRRVSAEVDLCMVRGLMPESATDSEVRSDNGRALITTHERLRVECSQRLELLLNDLLLAAPRLNRDKFHELLVLLAQKLGRELDLDEMSQVLGLGPEVLKEYVSALERCLAIKSCRSLHLAISGEKSDGLRIYFTDIALRNFLINDFSPVADRNEQELQALFASLFFMERYKKHDLERRQISIFYWKKTIVEPGSTNSVDFVELGDGMRAWQCGYREDLCAHFDPQSLFVKTYHQCSLHRVTPASLAACL